VDPERWKRLKEAFWAATGDDDDRTASGAERPPIDDLTLRRDAEQLAHVLAQLTSSSARATSPLIPSGTLVASRFHIVSALGSGRFGDVYRVIDTAADGEFALKVLRAPDPEAIWRFKAEVRRLDGLHHPNVVDRYELIQHDGLWMYTMAFVAGVDWRCYLSSQPRDHEHRAVRSCLLQIASGVAALHARDVLHRDLKPSNTLVTADGQLVLLDFGLVLAFKEERRRRMTFAGTPDYMSPEQAAGMPLREASDFYAIGVMVYEALTGQLPFHGAFLEVLSRKQAERPVAPSRLANDVPSDLDDLCIRLLDPDPERRATLEEVMTRLAPSAPPRPRVAPTRTFVGREGLLRQLEDAYTRAVHRLVVVHVSGQSGIGKTALLREFLRHRPSADSPLVFAGRCYDGESVPFQALDNLVDQIADHLKSLDDHQIDRWLPRHFAALVKMFPVLGQFLRESRTSLARLDPMELRVRALGALREMLGRFAEHHRVILAIDDLQWGDADGCTALRGLLSSADAPPMLVLLAYRSEDANANEGVRGLRDALEASSAETIAIDVQPLTSAESEALANARLTTPVERAVLNRVIDDSTGSPFLLDEMVQRVNQGAIERVLGHPFSINETVRLRVADISPASRHLLELVAVAGQPTPLSVLSACEPYPTVLASREELIAQRLLRSRMNRDEEELEVYHDRIRDALSSAFDAQSLASRHRELAEALVARGANDPERVAVHFELAGERDACARYALLAGRRAVEMLAFNKAARFFEMALSTGAVDASQVSRVQLAIGNALTNAGRGKEAAAHYLAACSGAARSEQLELKQRAAEQLLYSGHVDQGLAIFEDVLGQFDVPLPRPMSPMPLDLLLRRARLKLRGLRFREREAAAIPRDILLKVDACASVATGLSLIDIARGAALQTTSLLLALEAGEPSRVARALAMEAGYQSTTGLRSKARVDALLALARELSSRTGDSRAIGLTAVMTAGAAWSLGHWRQCAELANTARRVLLDHHERIVWERDTASIFQVEGLRWSGLWSDMTTILPELIEDARSRGDLYLQSILQMHAGSCAQLAADHPAAARDGLAILERWSNTGFHVEHLVETHNQVEIAIYEGDGEQAFARIQRKWSPLVGSLLMRVQNFNVQMRSLRARAALCAIAPTTRDATRRSLLQIAIGDCRAIARQDAAWGRVLAGLLEGGIASCSGRLDAAISAFDRAETAAESSSMLLHAAAARHARGRLLGGDAGSQLRAEARQRITSQAIANPERMALLIAPVQRL
jgi:eukaryotic-like serine/threonine-protein kinase